jgi:hypothetical protein
MSARTVVGSWRRVQEGHVWPAGEQQELCERPIAPRVAQPQPSGLPTAPAAAAIHLQLTRHQGRTGIQYP